jgi:polyhydroxyalkanoate synthesis regulator phasin
MKRTIANVLCGIAVVAAMTPSGVMAAENPAKVRKHEQKLQIKEAVKSGKLSRADAKRLKSELKSFRSQVKAAKANGKISPEDRARFKAERKRLRDEINTLELNAR